VQHDEPKRVTQLLIDFFGAKGARGSRSTFNR
jgi:hypothetical protein